MNVHVNPSTDSDTHHTRHIILLNKGPSSWEDLWACMYIQCIEYVPSVWSWSARLVRYLQFLRCLRMLGSLRLMLRAS